VKWNPRQSRITITEDFRMHKNFAICTIVPPHILDRLVEHGSKEARQRALRTLTLSARMRGHRDIASLLPNYAVAGTKRRTIYDAKHQENLPGTLVRGETARATSDRSVNEAYDYSGNVYDFYQQVFTRNSVDDRGLRLDSTVHFGDQYDNAFWNGNQMVYGDGDGTIFQRFTKCIDVIGHELTHGVTQYEAGLDYQGQSGALNESMSDVFGSLIKQWVAKQTAAKADWLIGKGLFTNKVKGVALRSMKDPGTAYNDSRLGKDPQPAHMKDYYKGSADNGGVHINSGIPNRAFYLTAIALGGYAWEKAGKIWYTALCNRLRPTSDFKAARQATISAAGQLYGAGGVEEKAVRDAWSQVGVV
jgi:Zn-dependent metalloprotease